MSILKSDLINRLSATIPIALCEALVAEYISLKTEYYLGNHRPAELDGGRLSEVVARILENILDSSYTPLGDTKYKPDNIFSRFESDSSQNEYLRFFVPRACKILMGIRNKRNVAHVSQFFNPNYSDSTFVLACANWVMTELVMHFANLPNRDAQDSIDNLNIKTIPIIWEINGFIKILDGNLSAKEKTLVLLHYKFNNPLSITEIIEWISYSNSSRFKKAILADLNAEALVHLEGDSVYITPKGIAFIEKNINLNKVLV